MTIAIQVNGKLRHSLTVSKDSIEDQDKIESLAKDSEKVQKYLEGKEVRKVIYVTGKILNFVI